MIDSQRRRHKQFCPNQGDPIMDSNRRRFLAASGVAGIGTLVLTQAEARADDKKNEMEEEVGAAEDLMREHGVLNRILLIYEEGLRRLHGKDDISPDVFHKPAL